MVGFGNNYPTHPHHRSSSCPDAPATCNWDTLYDTSVPNYHLLTGALVGGPRAADDQYTDVRTGFIFRHHLLKPNKTKNLLHPLIEIELKLFIFTLII